MLTFHFFFLVDKIADLYNYAVKMQPNNEELLAHLFMSHVRLEDFKAQQATALQLYKAHPKNAYYFWAVMSVFLQGVRGPERSNVTKKQIYLSLAQRMIDKMIQDNRLESDQELFLYLEILRNQHKYQEALDFIEDSNNVYQKLCLKVPVDFRLQLYKDLRKWRESHNLLKDLLCEELVFSQPYTDNSPLFIGIVFLFLAQIAGIIIKNI